MLQKTNSYIKKITEVINKRCLKKKIFFLKGDDISWNIFLKVDTFTVKELAFKLNYIYKCSWSKN